MKFTDQPVQLMDLNESFTFGWRAPFVTFNKVYVPLNGFMPKSSMGILLQLLLMQLSVL